MYAKSKTESKPEVKEDIDNSAIVIVRFNDDFGSVLVFRVRRRSNILALRVLAADGVAKCLQKVDDTTYSEQVQYLKQKKRSH